MASNLNIKVHGLPGKQKTPDRVTIGRNWVMVRRCVNRASRVKARMLPIERIP